MGKCAADKQANSKHLSGRVPRHSRRYWTSKRTATQKARTRQVCDDWWVKCTIHTKTKWMIWWCSPPFIASSSIYLVICFRSFSQRSRRDIVRCVVPASNNKRRQIDEPPLDHNFPVKFIRFLKPFALVCRLQRPLVSLTLSPPFRRAILLYLFRTRLSRNIRNDNINNKCHRCL